MSGPYLRNIKFTFLFIAILGFFDQSGQAADGLRFFKDYFVTGDYVASGVGLRGTGHSMADPCTDQNQANMPCPTKPTTWAGSYAKGSITISGRTCPSRW